MGESGNILIVDDEADIREIIKFNLEMAGYTIDGAASAEEALAILSDKHDLILLDVMLGGISGFEMAEKLRERDNNIPIIYLTAKTGEANMLKGFSTGGDDYITKPFSINEVLARVRAVLKRTAASPAPDPDDEEQNPDIIQMGQIRIDHVRKMVYIGDNPIALSKKEFEIISFLASHEGRVFSREDLISELWKEAPYVLARTVDVHIARIRSKLGSFKNCIANRSGYGYSFNSSEAV